jgi:hypothetical protein
VKPPYRIIIEHINHNPHGKDTPDKLNEEFVVLENEGPENVSLAGWTLKDETAHRSETPRLQVSEKDLPFLTGESLHSHRTRGRFFRTGKSFKVDPSLGKE